MTIAPATLVTVLSKPLRLFLLGEIGDGDIDVDGRKFIESGLGPSVGWYDWLRTHEGKIIGMRTWLLEDFEFPDLRASLTSHPAIEWDKNNFRLFLSAERKFDSKQSDDHDVGTHRLAIGPGGELLLTYDVQQLAADELQQIERMVGDVPN